MLFAYRVESFPHQLGETAFKVDKGLPDRMEWLVHVRGDVLPGVGGLGNKVSVDSFQGNEVG